MLSRGEWSNWLFRGLDTLEQRVLLAGDGLLGEYFDNLDLTSLVTTRVDSQVDFSFGYGEPIAGVDKNTFSIRWTGFVTPSVSGPVTFITETDDGARLWVDDELVIDWWQNQVQRERTGTIDLTAGVAVPIRMEFYDNTGGATARLLWEADGLPKAVIPQAALGTSATPPEPPAPSPGAIAFASANVGVGESAGTVTLNLTRTGGSSGAVSVAYAMTPGSATAGQDYTASSGTINFADGQTARSLVIPILPDDTEENDETFSVTLSNPTDGATLGSTTTTTVTIEDDDAPPPPPPPPGSGNGLLGEYFDNLDLTALVTTRVDPQVNFSFGGDSPVAGVDKNTFSIRWTGFVTPTVTGPITFTTNTDDGARLWVNDQLIIDKWQNQVLREHSGTIALQAGVAVPIRMEFYDNTGGATAQLLWEAAGLSKQVVPQSALSTTAEPPAPSPGAIAFASANVGVGESAGTVTLNLTRTGGSSGAVSVAYAMTPGSATAGQDYTASSGTINFADGQTTQTLVIPILPDDAEEADETFTVTLSAPTGGATLGATSSSVVTIEDDDAPPPPPPPPGSGNGLLGEYFDNLDLTALVTTRVDPQVNFSFGGDSPVAGVDKNTFSIRWTGFVTPTVSGPITFTTNTDDGARLWVNDQLIIDKWQNQVLREHSWTIALQAGVAVPIRMEFYDNTGGATAQLLWEAAGLSKQVVPQSALSTTAEPPPPGGTGTLALANATATVNEHDGTVTLTVNRTNGSSGTVSVNYTTGTPGNATAGQDYTTTAGTLSFSEGVTQRQIVIPITNDPAAEGDETFRLTLSNPAGGATLGSTTASTITIKDNDGSPTGRRILVLGSSSVEGNNSRNSFRRPLDSLLRQNGYNVNFIGTKNINGGSVPPTPDFDRDHEGYGGYRADEVLNGRSSAGVASLASRLTGNSADGVALTPDLALIYVGHNDIFQGQTPQNVSNDLSGIVAALRADNPSVTIFLGKLADSAWDGGIHNDEIAALNSLIDGLATSLNTTASPVLAVDLNTGFDTAVYTTDGQHPNPAGESFLADRWYAAMQPVLDSVPVNPGIASLESNSYSVNENAGTVTLAVHRINGTDGDVTVFYNTVEGSAKPGTDYVAQTGSVVIPDGQSRATFTVAIVNNTTAESTETFNVSIDGVAGGASLGAPRTATVTINDDDAPATVGDGLRGDYFRRDDLTDLALSRIDPQINFAFGSGSPDPSIANNYFSARWTGQILPRHSQTYTFYATSDDGMRVWVNNALIISDWGPHVLRTATGTIGLQAGVRVNIRVEYRENTGGAQAKLEWSSPSQAREVVPTSQLFSTGYTGNPGIPLTNQTLATGLTRPTTLKFLPNGNMLIGQQDGLVRTYKSGQLQTTPFIDLRSIVNFSGDRGLLSVAVHPDFPTQPYVYLLYTYDPPQTQSLTGPGGPDGSGNRGGRLMRVTADPATDYATAVPGSGVVILGTNSDWQHFGDPTLAPDINNQYGGYNPDGSYVRDSIPVDSQSHTIGDLAFLPDGSLLVTAGDGTAFGKTDLKAARVQDIDSLTGKLLRIDPITGQGLPSNPYYDGDPDSNRSKVYAFGFRNPFRITVDPDTGRIYVGDVGWNVWEEINLITPGANYGWPWYEGGEGTLAQTPNYRDTPEAQAFYAPNPDVQTALIARNHLQGNIAIVAGDFIQGNAYGSQYDNAFVFSDFGTGDLELVTFNASGGVANIDTASIFLSTPADLVLGPDGLLYVTDLYGGTVSRILPV